MLRNGLEMMKNISSGLLETAGLVQGEEPPQTPLRSTEAVEHCSVGYAFPQEVSEHRWVSFYVDFPLGVGS